VKDALIYLYLTQLYLTLHPGELLY